MINHLTKKYCLYDGIKFFFIEKNKVIITTTKVANKHFTKMVKELDKSFYINPIPTNFNSGFNYKNFYYQVHDSNSISSDEIQECVENFFENNKEIKVCILTRNPYKRLISGVSQILFHNNEFESILKNKHNDIYHQLNYLSNELQLKKIDKNFILTNYISSKELDILFKTITEWSIKNYKYITYNDHVNDYNFQLYSFLYNFKINKYKLLDIDKEDLSTSISFMDLRVGEYTSNMNNIVYNKVILLYFEYIERMMGNSNYDDFCSFILNKLKYENTFYNIINKL